MEKIEIYQSILNDLKSISAWCKNPTSALDVDYDNVFYKTLKEYQISMSFGALNAIFSLVDTMCDTVEHGLVDIKSNYTVQNGVHDLDKIIRLIELEDIDSLENDVALVKKLESLYD